MADKETSGAVGDACDARGHLLLRQARLLSVVCLAMFSGLSGGLVSQAQEAGKDAHSDVAKQRLPPPAVTEHSIDLGGRSIAFKAIIGAMPIKDESSGELLAEVVTTSFLRTTDAAKAGPDKPETQLSPRRLRLQWRPGGGLGWLDLGSDGAMAPAADGRGFGSFSAAYCVGQSRKLARFRHLVFIDPPGTGFSRVTGNEAARKKFWSVEGDVELLASVVRRWLQPGPKTRLPEIPGRRKLWGFSVRRKLLARCRKTKTSASTVSS